MRIPTSYRLLLLTLLAAALYGLGWKQGTQHTQEQWDRETKQQALQAATEEKKQAQATVQVVSKYADRIKTVRQEGANISKEISQHVPTQADAACTVPHGFVRVHDRAAQGNAHAEPTGDPDAAPAGIALSTVAETVVENYTSCRENAEQLSALQGWIHAMQEPASESGPEQGPAAAGKTPDGLFSEY
ncbi:hypothetical protein [Verminephrobacter aporrectodeae]|uniref:hypothetical protein n=1 Tax=Verminephrobacter aporrectodeae TaxID=1110389 RepID=UPI0002375E33|nr:hypothetical protein [Verminephrobacter aporrectodeae]